jgi:Cys-tRNA(Pro)/Cys-tRNA(Cys) deacylase
MTRGIAYLRDHGIPFKVMEYEHREKGALYASQAIGLPLEQTAKTLIVQLSDRRHLVVLMPGNKTIPFKELAKTYAVKRASMVDTATAERLSGYQVGGISPFGMSQSLPVAIDSDLLAFCDIAVNGGKRGVMLLMSPQDIVELTEANVLSFGSSG